MRLRKYAVSAEVMAAMLKTSEPGHWFRVKEGVPDSAEFVSAVADPERRAWWLIFQDDSFPHVPQGERIPVASEPIIEWRTE